MCSVVGMRVHYLPSPDSNAHPDLGRIATTAPIRSGYQPEPPRPKVDFGQLWAGGVAWRSRRLVAVVGILVCRWLFTAAIAALAATLLAHLLLVSTPRPLAFLRKRADRGANHQLGQGKPSAGARRIRR